MNKMEKLNAEQILKIIEDNYSVENFAYGEWGEINSEIEFSDKVVEVERNYELAKENFLNHPGYKNAELRDEEYLNLQDIWYKCPCPYQQKEKEIIEHLGLGEIKEVEQYGGEGDGSTWYSVKHFKDHGVYIRTDGHYESYNGTDFYEGYGKEVFPKQVTKTVYESNK